MSKYINLGDVFSFGRNNSISMSRHSNSVNINGVKIKVPNGSSVSSVNGEIFIDGKKYEGEELKNKEIVYVVIEGDVDNVDSDGDIFIKKNVNGNVKSSRDIEIGGDVHGEVSASRDVEVGNDVIGGIRAGIDVDIAGNYIKK